MVMLAPPKCHYCPRLALRRLGEDHLCAKCFGVEVHQTEESLDALIASRRSSMLAECGQERRVGKRPTLARIPKDRDSEYSLGSDALWHLVLSGTGGFTRALMEADKYLREHPDEPCVRAHANREQTEVTLRFAGGRTRTFANPTEGIDRRAALAKDTIVILKHLVRHGPQRITNLAAAVEFTWQRCLTIVRSHEELFASSGPVRTRVIDVTKAGRKRVAQDTGNRVRKGRVVA